MSLGLDELFDRGDDRPSVRGWPLLRWLATAAFVSLLLGGGVAVVLYALGAEFWYPLPPVVVFALVVLHRVARELAPDPAGPGAGGRALAGYWAGAGGEATLAGYADLGAGWRVERRRDAPDPDGLVPAVHRWETMLRWDRTGRWRGNRSLHPHLVELVEERLRQRHGCTLASDPQRVRRLLGERLYRYLTDPSARTPGARDLATMMTTMEEL